MSHSSGNGVPPASQSFGKTLVFVQSNTGKLFTTGANGVARTIVLAGGESVPNGDGILLDGKTLYVVQNALDAELGSSLYAVNARFDFPSPNASTPYWVTKLSK